MSLLTIYQAQYYAYQLTRKFSSSSSEKLNVALFDAQVELNPHQIEAALFALRSPLSKGAILADEVGLGKTIEAGILLSQFWAEKKQRLLVICPPSLRKQWSQELWDKFFLESIIMESKDFKNRGGKNNAFDTIKIIIVSYPFATKYADTIKLQKWDLVIIDEAHRLRNVYKPENKMGNAIKKALEHTKKILLTATPLQNNLLELYGLVSIIDDKIFGDKQSFQNQFMGIKSNHDKLRERLQSVAIRNLRKQVQEYIQYTNRIPLTIKFEPTIEEQTLYENVSHYLQQETIYALPKSQRHLITLVLRKLLASSSFAITKTLYTLIQKLENILKKNDAIDIAQDLLENYELYDEYEEENDDAEARDILKDELLSDTDIALIQKEIIALSEYHNLAQSIQYNEKGGKLLTALEEGFSKVDKRAEKKAIIFTESRRTQEYLLQLLSKYYPNKIVLFNGTNTDSLSYEIYQKWLDEHKHTNQISGSRTADTRAALVDYFKKNAMIMIATEAAAEGLNLQFCSLLVNYDLPWNPQRVEQRIGRCHRYGQKYDVVVVNFINVKNAADIRVFELLEHKFQLFSGVFGASDEVLGNIEDGLDFEKSIANIYQQCRTEDEIKIAFDRLQQESSDKINTKMLEARNALFTNFDDEVTSKLKQRLTESKEYLSKYQEWLWEITKFQLQDIASFNEQYYTFSLYKQPFLGHKYPLHENYALGKNTVQPHIYRSQDPLAQQVLRTIKEQKLPHAHLTFSIQGISNTLEPIRNKSGWLCLILISIQSLEESEYIVPFGWQIDNEPLSPEQAQKLLCQPASIQKKQSSYSIEYNYSVLKKQQESEVDRIKRLVSDESSAYFQERKDQIYNWADDKLSSAESILEETRKKIKQLKKEARNIGGNITEGLKYEKEIHALELKLKKQKQEYSDIEDDIYDQRSNLIKEIERKLSSSENVTQIFTITWDLV